MECQVFLVLLMVSSVNSYIFGGLVHIILVIIILLLLFLLLIFDFKFFVHNRKRLDATRQDLEDKQNSKRDAVRILPFHTFAHLENTFPPQTIRCFALYILNYQICLICTLQPLESDKKQSSPV